MRIHPGLAVLVVAVIFPLQGCESGPSGPGVLEAAVESAATQFGAAVIEVQGAGITDFEGEGTTRVFWSATGQPDRYRIVVVSAEGSNSIPIRIRVRDLSGPLPQGTVMEASDRTDRPLSVLSSFSVRVTEP